MEKHKYPRTLHVPQSPGASSDDKILKSCDHFIGKRVIVTRKMDGENFTGYANGETHARSIDGRSHWTRNWAKNYWTRRSYMLQSGYRVCAENLYAQHSIAYMDLPTLLPLISVWDRQNNCLSWDDTKGWAIRLNMEPVPVLYDGMWDEALFLSLHDPAHEGLVVRVADAFHYDQFADNVAKYVRAGHVTTSDHWMHGEIKKNELDESSPFCH